MTKDAKVRFANVPLARSRLSDPSPTAAAGLPSGMYGGSSTGDVDVCCSAGVAATVTGWQNAGSVSLCFSM